MKIILTILLTLFSAAVSAQSPKTEVMTLGTFHFNFPNLDVNQINKNDQIDVLEPGFQKEIENIVSKVSRFKPTIIVIERQPSEQHNTDTIFGQFYLENINLKEMKRNSLALDWQSVSG